MQISKQFIVEPLSHSYLKQSTIQLSIQCFACGHMKDFNKFDLEISIKKYNLSEIVSWLVKINKDWMGIKRETPREGTGYNSAGGGGGGNTNFGTRYCICQIYGTFIFRKWLHSTKINRELCLSLTVQWKESFLSR